MYIYIYIGRSFGLQSKYAHLCSAALLVVAYFNIGNSTYLYKTYCCSINI